MNFLSVFLQASLAFSAPGPLMRDLTVLNQFGAKASPAADSARYRELTAFMAHGRRGGTLKLASNESMVSIFPTAIRNGDFRARAPLATPFIYETLFTSDPRQDDATIYPLGALKVRSSEDFCRLEVELRPELHFSDGSPLRTSDVQYSLTQFTDEFFSGAMAELIHQSWGKPVLTPRGETTFDVEFTELPTTGCRQAAYYFLGGTPLIKPNPDARKGDPVEQPYIGTGPYRVVHAARALLRYKYDPDYWGRSHEQRAQTFNPDVIEVRVFNDPILERFALLTGQVDLLRETRFTYDAWMAKKMAQHPIEFVDQVSEEIAAESGVIHMNQFHEHTRDPNFRRALLLAWDLAAASREFYGGRRTALTSPGANSDFAPRGQPSPEVRAILARAADVPEFTEASGPAEELTYEKLGRVRGERARLALALEHLKRGGYSLERVKGQIVLVKNGRPVEITAITRGGSPELRLFLLFKRQLRKIGINLILRDFSDRTALVAALKNNQYDLFPSELAIPRAFQYLNTSWLSVELHSRANNQLGAWSRLNSKLMDVTIEELEKRTAGTPEYAPAVEAFLRAFNAVMPMLPSGEVSTVRTYHHRDLHVWDQRDRDLWTLYF